MELESDLSKHHSKITPKRQETIISLSHYDYSSQNQDVSEHTWFFKQKGETSDSYQTQKQSLKYEV